MHLKKIEIQGFKSFADKIEIEFKEGITAIVGPNGSGKSNISDAIRWVLGEQSVKTLRGSKMEDIIFSGTKKRKALGYAEVTITFDNKDGMIPIDYQEVAITRRMFRSGESEYYINKNSCRLKDIKELFMDTGVGKDGYSIIGQGRVDEILSSRPEDRRNIFEEAAGIVKYKSKKIEAEKRLEKTDNNLIRIKDIIGELEKQSKSLKDQSERASIFIQLSNKLKELEVNLFIRKIDAIRKEMEKGKGEKSKLLIQIDRVLEEKNKIEQTLDSMNIKIEDMDLAIDMAQKEKVETLNLLNENGNNLKLLKEKKKFYIKDVERLNKEIENFGIDLKKLEDEKLFLLEERKDIYEQFNSLKREFNTKETELKRLSEEIGLKEKTIEKEKDKIIDLYNLITDKKSNINSIISFQENIRKRIIQIEKDIENLKEQRKSNNELLKDMEELELEKKEEVITYNKSLANLRLEEKENKEKLDNLYKKINQNKVDLQGKISNFNLLKNMEEDYEGYYKSVKNLMVACKKENELEIRLIGIVADLIKVDEKYEKAIDVGLGGSLQNIITADEKDAKFIIDYLRKNNLGRVTFLPLSTIKGNSIYISPKDREKYNIIGLGSELVYCDNKYKNIVEYLLGRTIVVEDLDKAVLVANRFNYRFKIVNLDGDIINPGGSMTGGSLPKISGNLLNRKYRIEKLKREINSLSKTQRDLEEKKVVLKHNLEDNLKQLNLQEERLQNANIEIIKIENEKGKHKIELKRIFESIEKYKGEIDKLNLELNGISQDKEKLDEELEVLNKENSFIKENIKDFMLRFEEEKTIKEEAEKEVTDAKIQISLLENKLANKIEKIQEIKKELKDKMDLKKAKEEECSKNKKEIDNIINKILYAEENLDELFKIKEEKDQNLHLLKRNKNKFMEDYYSKQNRLKDINEKLNNLEKEQNNWNIKEAKYSVQLDNINIKLLEDYELRYEEAAKLWIEIEDLNKAARKVKSLKSEIKELGVVNLSSIEEYKQVSERLDFIAKQHEDLLAAKKNLQEVIMNMETKMTEQFLYNFKRINESFNQVFSVLFDGGRAGLILEDEQNVLDCGIEIQAQPPGKKLQNLSLLSGGEKSLTAVALLFAILKIKPSPFCVLDEIDAALDEANINRYTNYLKNFSHETQFIMITHRKGTMEMAHVLYGVTMEEDGISKMISVKLTDNLEEIAS